MIFNIGLNRCGTTSLTEALNVLGIPAVHHHHRGRRLAEVARANAAAGRRLFDGLDQQFTAFSDFGGRRTYRLLDTQYPGSRFILTTRELSSWLDSRERKVRDNLAKPVPGPSHRRIDREGWARHRAEYEAALARYFADRPGDLLTIDIPGGQGWPELCAFLDLPVPETPFPNRNRLAT
jgi:hypothetical protein